MDNKVVLTPSGRLYAVQEPFKYKDIVVPKGFPTDGLSYKLRVLALFINRFDPRYITAAVVHDYLCEEEDYEKADNYFEELLPEGARKTVMVFAVRVYHKIVYNT